MANDIFSFAELAAATGITSDVMFVWQDQMRAVPHLDGVTAVKEDVPFNAAGTMLSGELTAEGDRLDLHILRALRGETLPEDYYYTFLLREQKAAQTDAYREAKQYFSNLLGDTRWCNIPKPDFASWDSEGAEEMIGLSLTLKQMKEAQARLKASGNVICLAAGALALQEYCKKEDVLLNWINDNRSRAGNETTVGLLFKILPVALHMDEYSGEKSLVEEIRRQTEAGFVHSICDYQEITELALEDSIEINYLPGLADAEEQTDETGILEEVEITEAHNAAGGRVGMYIGDMDGVLVVSCSYQKRIYAPGSMRRFLELFRKHLHAIVLEP